MNRRSPNLSDNDILQIVLILDSWEGKLTWKLLLQSIELKMRRQYVRQTIAKYARVMDAFHAKKLTLKKVGLGHVERGPIELRKSKEKIAKLKLENDRLKRENEQLLLQFTRWVYNAHLAGFDEKFLDRPLPEINRC